MRFFLLLFSLISTQLIYSQGCCSGGGGNPLAGGAATVVLQKGQMEILGSYKYNKSDRFMSGDRDTVEFFDNLASNYFFLKADYGISEKLTFSVSAGYYLNRTITEFADTSFIGGAMEIEQHKVESSGIGDLILFPKYSVYNKSKGVNRTEVTLGLGWKIPLGSHRDSNFVGYSKFINFDTPTPFIDSTEIWSTSPPTVQTTTGSHDLMAYGMFFKSYPIRKFRVFATALYVRKGWNSLGLKFGDYASVGLFAGTTVFKNLGLTGQLKGEWVGKMKTADIKSFDPISLYSIDTASTGSRKLSFVPQVSYSFKGGITLFALADIPIYQYLRGTQIASKYDFTAGLSYRFFVVKPKVIEDELPITLPVEITEVTKESSFKVLGNCEMCEKRIEGAIGNMKGISLADWDYETQMLKIYYDENTVEPDDVKSKLAKLGHDSETHKATDRAYNKLHDCCKYDR